MDGKDSIKTFIRSVADTKPKIWMGRIYVVTKHLVVEYSKDNKGFHFCGWMNRLCDDNEVNWTEILVKNENFCHIL